MKLVANWRAIALRAHSMWAFYLSVLCLIASDAIYFFAGVDTSPRLWWLLALALLIYGIWGRLKDQGIDRTKLQTHWITGLLAIGAVAAFLLSNGQEGRAVDPEPTETAATVLPVSDSAFLQVALPFFETWEGLSLVPYRDLAGVLTICYGETKGVAVDDRYTQAECQAMLAREVLVYRAGLHTFYTVETRTTRLPPLRDVAFVSLAYNIGVTAAGGSTAVRRLNAGHVAAACEALTWWNKSGDRIIRGLVRRRAEERQLCLEGWA